LVLAGTHSPFARYLDQSISAHEHPERIMRLCFRDGALALLLLGSVGLGNAQSAGAQNQGLGLTPTQRATIFNVITQQKEKIPPPPNFQATIGADAPASIALYLLPQEAAAAIPDGDLYKYTIVQNQVVLIDPVRMKVIDVIR
jgi:hypothetical protein